MLCFLSSYQVMMPSPISQTPWGSFIRLRIRTVSMHVSLARFLHFAHKLASDVSPPRCWLLALQIVMLTPPPTRARIRAQPASTLLHFSDHAWTLKLLHEKWAKDYSATGDISLRLEIGPQDRQTGKAGPSSQPAFLKDRYSTEVSDKCHYIGPEISLRHLSIHLRKDNLFIISLACTRIYPEREKSLADSLVEVAHWNPLPPFLGDKAQPCKVSTGKRSRNTNLDWCSRDTLPVQGQSVGPL
jgi:hypothetical protein